MVSEQQTADDSTELEILVSDGQGGEDESSDDSESDADSDSDSDSVGAPSEGNEGANPV